MGQPKFSRKKYDSPTHPWQGQRIKEENEIKKKFGLKNKKEIWRIESFLREARGQARDLQARLRTKDVQASKEAKRLIDRLARIGILSKNSTIDDVLALEIESLLNRRLQTLTYMKGLARTVEQARQLIKHGHIEINGRKVTVPGYFVRVEEVDHIAYHEGSPLTSEMHPMRPQPDFKPEAIKLDLGELEDKGRGGGRGRGQGGSRGRREGGHEGGGRFEGPRSKPARAASSQTAHDSGGL